MITKTIRSALNALSKAFNIIISILALTFAFLGICAIIIGLFILEIFSKDNLKKCKRMFKLDKTY
ncbi:hypothetical protein UPTC15610_00620 [Campylobacter lari]